MLKFLIPCAVAVLSVSQVFAFDDAIPAASEVTEPVSVLTEDAGDAVVSEAEVAQSLDIAPVADAAFAPHSEAVIVDPSTVQVVQGNPGVARVYPAYRQAPRHSAGFFSNLMELERRKNAWLKRTFLGM